MPADDLAVVTLADVDEAVLGEVVRVATADASANEVTPPLTSGDSWTRARVKWLWDYHRDCRAGLNGPRGEATWAVIAAGGVVGSVRLKRTTTAGVLETGVWLARSGRGQGIGTAAACAVFRLATALGATAVCADTTSTNVQALAVLKRAGFSVSPTNSSGLVHARMDIEPLTTS